MADASSHFAAATIAVIKPLWFPAVGEEPVGEETAVAAGLWTGGKWQGQKLQPPQHSPLPTCLLCSPPQGSRTTARGIIMDHLQVAVMWKSNPRYNHCAAVTATAAGIASSLLG